jgi:hypothetical protein
MAPITRALCHSQSANCGLTDRMASTIESLESIEASATPSTEMKRDDLRTRSVRGVKMSSACGGSFEWRARESHYGASEGPSCTAKLQELAKELLHLLSRAMLRAEAEAQSLLPPTTSTTQPRGIHLTVHLY